MNEAILRMKAVTDDANRRLAEMPEDQLHPKHIKGQAWCLANKDWKVTPFTDKQAGFLAGARALVAGLAESGQLLVDAAQALWLKNVTLCNMANQATLAMAAWGGCTAEKGYYAEPDKLAQDIRALCERNEKQKCGEDRAYQQGYAAGVKAEQDRLAEQGAAAITNERDAESIKIMAVLGDDFYLTYSKLLKKWIVSVEDGKDGKEWADESLRKTLAKAEAATGHRQIPCIYCGGTYETIQPGCCPKNPLSPDSGQARTDANGPEYVITNVEHAEPEAPEQADAVPQAPEEVES